MSFTVYLDTCVVRETYKGTINDEDFQALAVLAEKEEIVFVVSDVMKEELEKIKDDKQRASLAVLYKIFNKCNRYATVHSVMSGAFDRTPFDRSPSAYDPLYESIKHIFTQNDKDPEHIFQAIKNNCSHYLTIDYKSILKKAEKHREELLEICPEIEFVSPKSLLSAIEVSSN